MRGGRGDGEKRGEEGGRGEVRERRKRGRGDPTRSEGMERTVLFKPGEHRPTQLIMVASGHCAVVGLKQLLQNEAVLNVSESRENHTTVNLEQFFLPTAKNYVCLQNYDVKKCTCVQ